MQFKIPFELPIAQKSLRYREISNEMYFNILKYTSTNDNSTIESMFDDLVTFTTGEDAHKLYAADKFCLLMDLRSVTLGDSIEFTTSANATVKLKLSDILTNIRSVLCSKTFSKNIVIGDITLCVDVPRQFLIHDIDTLVSCTINTITDGESTAVFDQLSQTQKEQVLSSLPADIFNQIIAHVNSCKSKCSNTFIMQTNQTLGIEEIPFNLFDTTMFEFLKFIYSGDLMNFYELQYSLITKLHLSYDHFMKMTPNESRIYINLHSRDIKKQESEKLNSTPSRFNT